MRLDSIFLNPVGLYTLLALIPFIIFYIIKPKPKKIIIPSLMFFIKDKSKSNLNSFLQKFFSDIFFFLQLFILLLLMFTIAKPFLVVPSISYADSMVFVIDASASMNAIEDGKTRFERAIETAQDNIEGKNTIILATDQSQLMLENGGRSDTKKMLETLKCRETPSSNVYDTIVLGENFAVTDKSAVFFISDFSNDLVEREFLRAKLYLESKGIDVFFEDVSRNKARNVGIIDLEVKEGESTVWIKNFNPNTETFNLKYGDKTETITIEPLDVVSYSFTSLTGESTVEIDVKDDFKIDNYAYISTPAESSINVMIITNDDEKYLTTVLGIMNKINVNIQKPPIVSFGDPDIIIIGNIDKKVLIPGDISKVKGLVSDSGIPVIILAQDKILDLGLGNLLPIEFEKSDPITVTDLRSSYNIVPTQPNSYLTPTESLGQTRKIYQTKENDNVITYAYSMKNNYPVITLSSYGLGKVLFYGLFDEYSDFKADSYYPVFWKRVIDLLLGGKTTAEINKQAGYMQILGKEQTVDTPKGKRTGKIVSLDYTGFYRFNTYTIATNILSEEEQRLNKDSITIEASDLSVESKKIQNETRDKEITFILLVIATIFLLAEFILLKFRGDF